MENERLWAAYVRDVTYPLTDQSAIAKRVGISQGTISRWLGGKYLPDKAATVAHFAQVHGRNVLEAFVAAGMLDLETARRGLPAQSVHLIWSLSVEGDEIPAVAEGGDIEGPGEDSI